MQTAATATRDQGLIAAGEILTDISGLLDEVEPLLAGVAAQAYTRGDLEKPSIDQRKTEKSNGFRTTHRLCITAVLEINKFYPDTIR